MRKLIVITSVVLLLILSGCSSPAGNNNQVNNVVPDTPSRQEILYSAKEITITEKIDTSASATAFSVPLGEGLEIGSYTCVDDRLYFAAVKVIDMAEMYPTEGLYCYDTTAAKLTKIRSFDGNVYINELFADGDRLFYVEYLPEPRKIVMTDLLSGHEETIAESNAEGGSFVLYYNSGILVWYSAEGSELSLNYYDTASGDKGVIADHLTAYSAYERPYITDGLVPYVKDGDNCRIITAYGLREKKDIYSFKISKDITACGIKTGKDKVFFRDGYVHDSRKYLIDVSTGEFTSFALKDGSISVNTYGEFLSGDHIIAMSASSKSAVSIDLKDMSYSITGLQAASSDQRGEFPVYDSKGRLITLFGTLNTFYIVDLMK